MSDLNLKKYTDLAVVEEPADGTTLLAVDPDGLLTRVPNQGNTPAPGGLGGVPSTIFVPVWTAEINDMTVPSPYRFPLDAVQEHVITTEDNVYYNTVLDCFLERNPQSINDLCLNYDLSNLQIVGVEKIPAESSADPAPEQYIDKFGYTFGYEFWLPYENDWTQIPDTDIFMNDLVQQPLQLDVFNNYENPQLNAEVQVYKIGDNGIPTYSSMVYWTATNNGDPLEVPVLFPDDFATRLAELWSN